MLNELNLDKALGYAEKGWPVLVLYTLLQDGACSCGKSQCPSAGKHPRTRTGLKEATTNINQIKNWWAKWPNANIGICTGEASGFIVLDVDPRNGGNESLTKLEKENGILPITVEAVTGGGGRHILFKCPKTKIKNGSNVVGPGLDIKATGGYIVAPGSLHSSGNTYEWLEKCSPEECKIADMPTWLENILLGNHTRIRTPSPTSKKDLIPEGKRNSTLASLAGTMRNRGMSEEAIEQALLAENEAKCMPPLSEVEVLGIAKSISKYPTEDQNIPKEIIFDKEQIKNLAPHYQKLKTIIGQHYPSVLPQLHAMLSAIASTCWSDFPLPVTLITCGPPSSGKTVPLMWILRSKLPYFVRSDQFTSASFVSHASNVKRETLEKNDLLPKIKDKVLITKELAPLFASKEDELRKSFGLLASVLDGEGLITNSGTHGVRGYDESINFAWLGATTPPSKTVFNVMAHLGTRLFFFSTDTEPPSAKDYVKAIQNKDEKENGTEKLCFEAVSSYLINFFEVCPVRSVPFDSITLPDNIAQGIGLLCEALTKLRGTINLSEGNDVGEDRYSTPMVEHGWRAAKVLSALAKCSALICGRSTVSSSDLRFIKRVVLSSMPEVRRKTFEAVLASNGRITALQVSRHAKMAKKTALHYLKELAILGIFEPLLEREDGTNEIFTFKLKQEFHSLLNEHNSNFGNTKSVSQNGVVSLFDEIPS